MAFISVTRLRLRSVRFFPAFAVYTLASLRQARRAEGFRDGALMSDRRFAFWTLTRWDGPEAMRRFMLNGAHKRAMPRLMHWCDEGSVVHWDSSEAELPGWDEAARRMRAEGRPSKVRHASPQHSELAFAAPRPYGGGLIRPHAR